MHISDVNNCYTWGPVLGRHKEFPSLVATSTIHYRKVYPGMLVTSYEGLLTEMQKIGYDHPGLGIIIAVMPHPEPRGDIRYMCTVLWNWCK